MPLRYLLLACFFFANLTPSFSQEARQHYLGYNWFNEIYAGLNFPKATKNKVAVQAGYQFALSEHAQYEDGSNPFLTNNAYGLRLRVGYQLAISEEEGSAALFIEYQYLQTKLFTDQSSIFVWPSYSDLFTETHSKIGIRIASEVSILKSNFYFTGSLGLFVMKIHRTYINPPNAPEDSQRANMQITLGIKFYISSR